MVSFNNNLKVSNLIVEELHELFQLIDVDRSAAISKSELNKALESHVNSQLIDIQSLPKILNEIDEDKNGLIDFKEFMLAAINNTLLMSENNLTSLYKMIDEKNKGYITLHEF